MPLPPYIDRGPEDSDRERYQTVYARTLGAIAAPTAGLHFDAAIFAELRARGVAQTFVTLHVGAGTFAPMRAEDIDQHRCTLNSWTYRRAPAARSSARGGQEAA